LSGVAVVTGCTHGIGRVTARELANAGRDLVMLCRDVSAANAVREEILGTATKTAIRVIHCDLGSLASVRECAAVVRRDVGRISVLINNAGIVSTRRRVSVDGFELTFATNFLGPFLLTSLLVDRMAVDGRIVNVASRAHLRSKLDLIRAPYARGFYNGAAVYAQSKLANVLHSFALARRLTGTGVTANCLHPGVVATNLLPRWLRVVKPVLSPVIFDAERGARTTLYLALSDRVASVTGEYFDEYQRVGVAAACTADVALQEALWQESERWVGIAAGAHREAHRLQRAAAAGDDPPRVLEL
jgi:NAD(P)-dependent dehydrogenase (short-subunit alcohol dehydrogenase family)